SGIGRCLHHQRRNGADDRRLSDPTFAVAREIVNHLASACRMTDMDRILEVEMLDHGRKVVRVMIHIMPVANLRRPAVASPVMRYDAIALAQEEQHLRVPVIGRKRPAMAEHNRLTRTPILVEDLDAVFSSDYGHALTLALTDGTPLYYCFKKEILGVSCLSVRFRLANNVGYWHKADVYAESSDVQFPVKSGC